MMVNINQSSFCKTNSIVSIRHCDLVDFTVLTLSESIFPM